MYFVVDKMEDKFGAQNDTAPMQCMEAVKIVRGRGREEERELVARRLKNRGMSPAEISDITGLQLEAVINLK